MSEASTGEKKIKGRKRHIVTDILGNILSVNIHAANIHDTVGGCNTFDNALRKYPSIKGACADEGYRKTFEIHLSALGKIVEISKKAVDGWQVLPKRWRVERTLSWLNHSRRLSKDYEIATYSQKNYIFISHSHTLLNRIA